MLIPISSYAAYMTLSKVRPSNPAMAIVSEGDPENVTLVVSVPKEFFDLYVKAGPDVRTGHMPEAVKPTVHTGPGLAPFGPKGNPVNDGNALVEEPTPEEVAKPEPVPDAPQGDTPQVAVPEGDPVPGPGTLGDVDPAPEGGEQTPRIEDVAASLGDAGAAPADGVDSKIL